jgi:hypothetical protein
MEVRMKKTFTLLALGAITLTLLAFAFVTVQAKSEGNAVLQTTATPTALASASSATAASGDVVVWDQFCVRKVPYTLVALPQNASFEVVQSDRAVMPTPIISTGNSNEIACESVGIYRDRQVVVCRGPQLYNITLHVSGDGANEDFQVPLKACPIPQQPE